MIARLDIKIYSGIRCKRGYLPKRFYLAIYALIADLAVSREVEYLMINIKLILINHRLQKC